MEESIYDIEQIDQYLSGNFSEQEATIFEKKMEEDPVFQKAVKDVIRAKSASYLAGREKWIAQMDQKFDAHLKPRRFRLWPLLMAAMIAAMLLVAGIWWYQQEAPLSGSQVYAQVYEIPSAPEYRGDNKGLDSLLALAYGSFNSRAFAESLPQFDQLLGRDDIPNKEEALFFKGIALLELQEEQDALEFLAQVRGEQYGESARYYEALILLKQGKTQEAKQALTDLLDFDGTWKGRAEEILELLGE